MAKFYRGFCHFSLTAVLFAKLCLFVRHSAIFAGRHSRCFAEEAGEVVGVLKAKVVTNFANAQLRVLQLILCLADNRIVYVGLCRDVERAAHNIAQIVCRYAELCGARCYGRYLSVLF